jgi:hypothetical protein
MIFNEFFSNLTDLELWENKYAVTKWSRDEKFCVAYVYGMYRGQLLTVVKKLR